MSRDSQDKRNFIVRDTTDTTPKKTSHRADALSARPTTTTGYDQRNRVGVGLQMDSSANRESIKNGCKCLTTWCGQGRNRTADASLFRAALYRAYLAEIIDPTLELAVKKLGLSATNCNQRARSDLLSFEIVPIHGRKSPQSHTAGGESHLLPSIDGRPRPNFCFDAFTPIMAFCGSCKAK